jgi:hypothetical protein
VLAAPQAACAPAACVLAALVALRCWEHWVQQGLGEAAPAALEAAWWPEENSAEKCPEQRWLITLTIPCNKGPSKTYWWLQIQARSVQLP